ncbi:MAG: hypothetical protein N3A01_00310 [Bacteroidales bacterium]|nr:hypothetical protein [Bacteroidales bacterium]
MPIKHSEHVTKMTYDPVKHYYVYTGSKDGSVIAWTYNGIFLKRFDFHSSAITDIIADLNNSFLYTADQNGFIFKININNSSVVSSFKTETPVTCLLYARNKTKEYVIAGFQNGNISIFDTALNIVRSFNYYNKYPIKIVPSKKQHQYFVGFKKNETFSDSVNESKSNIEIIDLDNFKCYPLSPYFDNLSDLFLSRDSTRLISASSDNNTIRVFDGLRLIELNSFKVNFKPSVVFMSNNNKLIGIGSAETGEAQIRRYTGEPLMDYSLKSEKIIFGEFNDDITRIHLCTEDGVFNLYDFNGNYRENRGVYVNIANKISHISCNDSLIYFATENGKIAIFNYKNKTFNYLKDSFNVNIQKIVSYNNLLIILLSPEVKVSDISLESTITSKLFIYDSNQLIKEFKYNDKYITDFLIIYNYLVTFFNTGETLIHNLNNLTTINKYNFKPIEIVRAFKNNNKVLLDYIDNSAIVFEFNITDKPFFKELKKFKLNNNEKILAFSEKYIVTNKRILELSSEIEFKHLFDLKSAFIYNDTLIALDNYHIYKFIITKQNLAIIDKSKSESGNLFVLNDNTIFINSKVGYVSILRLCNLKEKFGFYFNNNLDWIITDGENYEISNNLYNSVITVKGLIITNNKKIIEERIKNDILKKIFCKKI